MDLILISRSKLKIMLTADDMAEYSLNCDNINYDNTETRRAFWEILDAAKHKTGFDAASDRVYIQVYPSKGGGCEMYVTKLKISDDDKASQPCAGDSGVKLGEGAGAFRFSGIEALLSCCRRLKSEGYTGGSWSGFDKISNRYYLLLYNNSEACTSAVEYGERITSHISTLVAGEYTQTICTENAVEVLAEY